MTTTLRTPPMPHLGPRLWAPGDWNAFFGFGTNILVNLLVLTGLLRYVLKMPDAIVFGRILPAAGLMMALSTLYYAYLAWQLAKKTGRSDVCALPSGISVPHTFVVVFVIMLPISLSTGYPVKGWEAGLTWVFIHSFVLMIGSFIAPVIRRITPPLHPSCLFQPLQQRGQRIAVQHQRRPDLPHGLPVLGPERGQRQILRIGQAQRFQQRLVGRLHRMGSRVQRKAQHLGRGQGVTHAS